MNDRPPVSRRLDGKTFRSYYYLKDELIAFCRQEELQTAGGKVDLTNRIAHYLDTGERLSSKIRARASSRAEAITTDAFIEDNFVCSETHRAFFTGEIGKSFSFNVTFQRWLKANAGRTYQEAINAYYEILASKQRGKTSIDKQFEYNAYIRDFFADNKGKALGDAIKCWNYKKGAPGHNRYEKSDLLALEE